MTERLRNWKSDVDAIRRVLMSEWDPIGCGVPVDEYDGYIPVIYRLLQEGANAVQLSAHLYQLETKNMGLQGNKEGCDRTAKALLGLPLSFDRSSGPAPQS